VFPLFSQTVSSNRISTDLFFLSLILEVSCVTPPLCLHECRIAALALAHAQTNTRVNPAVYFQSTLLLPRLLLFFVLLQQLLLLLLLLLLYVYYYYYFYYFGSTPFPFSQTVSSNLIGVITVPLFLSLLLDVYCITPPISFT